MSQAIAAVGQIHLASEFQKLFEKYKIKTGQILISPDDTEQRRRALNVRRTFDNLFKLNAIPIILELGLPRKRWELPKGLLNLH